MPRHHILKVIESRPRQAHVGVGALQVVLGAADHMGQIDAEAGVTAAGIFTRLMGIENGDFVIGPVLSETPRRRQPGVARANDGPIGLHIAGKRRLCLALWQDEAPAVGAVVHRQVRNAHGQKFTG